MTSVEDRLAKLERLVEAQQATIEAKDREIERLQTRVADLERRLGENSSNSSKPPSTDSPADRHARPKDAPSGNSRGGQRGHKGHKRTSAGDGPPAEAAATAAICSPPTSSR